ncbi:MAG: universal stress protein [Actinomycetota bacterium]
MDRPAALPLAWAVALVATTGSLYYSEVAGYVPCTICWYQRVAMYPMALVLCIASFRRDSAMPGYNAADALEALSRITEAAIGPEAAATVDQQVVCDLPARALVEAAVGKELLVLGARGLGGFRGLLVGSVSQRCLRHSATPVAIIRKIPDGPTNREERVVAAVDGSDTANRALRWALEAARVRGATLEVVHAWLPPYIGGLATTPSESRPYEHASRQVIDAALAAVDADTFDVPIRPISIERSPAGAILDAAEGADLVVMGSRGLGVFKGVLIGSVATQVTNHATCPVVVVPPSRLQIGEGPRRRAALE